MRIYREIDDASRELIGKPTNGIWFCQFMVIETLVRSQCLLHLLTGEFKYENFAASALCVNGHAYYLRSIDPSMLLRYSIKNQNDFEPLLALNSVTASPFLVGLLPLMDMLYHAEDNENSQ